MRLLCLAGQLHSSMPQVKTALILDPDMGFGFWLARGLDQSDISRSFLARAASWSDDRYS